MKPDELTGQTLREREDALSARESALLSREETLRLREQAQSLMAEAQEVVSLRNREMRLANQNLVLATLEAKRLTEAADLARRRQDRFVAMLAHELRNPLAPIRSAGAFLAKLDANAPVPPLIHQVIERQVEQMARLLDDLLDVSRVTTGKVQLQRRPTRVATFVDQAVETFRSLFDIQHQQLSVHVPETPIYVDGDPMRLEQVVGNLLHNAAKYTDVGGAISIRVRALERQVEIVVSDTGIGIAADALPHVFDLFTQNDRSLSRSQGGLGIGLTIVRGMVDLHGGTIEARSAGPGLGSEFIVSLPRVDPPAERPEATIEATGSAAATTSVLLIDDNVDAGELLAMVLRLSGHDVATAIDGPSGLLLFERDHPQVVVCDIGLPGIDGYEVARRIVALDSTPLPLMIALTGYGGPADRELSRSAGFAHHLTKPTDPDVILRLIDGFMLSRPVSDR